MGSFIGTLKMELVYHVAYHTRNEARSNLFEHNEMPYNRHRPHRALRHLSPVGHEQLGESDNSVSLT